MNEYFYENIFMVQIDTKIDLIRFSLLKRITLFIK